MPALLSVAFVTVAERKTMASMQRRIGPNIIGPYGLLQPFLKQPKYTRSFHTHRTLYKSSEFNSENNPKNKNNSSEDTEAMLAQAIEWLYKDRVAPVKAFNKEKILDTCSNYLNKEEKEKFLDKWGNKGGIYLIQYKNDPYIFYIGRTTQFRERIRNHMKSRAKDKFHVFAQLVGWENFEISIVELCPKEQQGILENSYLQEYLPLLNSSFISNFSESIIFQTLRSILKNKQAKLNNESSNSINRNAGIPIFVYKYNNNKIEENYSTYESMTLASQSTGIARSTIRVYLDTSVPSKGFLFYSKPITDFALVVDQVKEAIVNLNIDSNIPKKVWVYAPETLQLVNSQPFHFSKEKWVANFIETSHKVVRDYVDSWKPEPTKGYYLFSKPLTEKEIIDLVKSSQSITPS